MTNAPVFNPSTGKYSYTDASGKRRSSPDIGYIFSQYAKDNESTIRGGTLTEVNGTVAEEPKVEFSINQRFDFIADYVMMVASGVQPSMVVTGPGGLGKSYTVVSTLVAAGHTDVTNLSNLEEGTTLPRAKFKIIKGYSTAKSLYRTLYENKDAGSVILFDDCDSVLKDANAVNLLKGALDTTDERIICWNSEPMGGDDLPRSFRFEGAVIFISNLSKDQIPQALRTRSVCIDVSMTTDQKIERMTSIAKSDHFMPEVDISIKSAALDMISRYKDVANEISMRSLVQVVRIGMQYTGERFENLAKYSLVN